MLNLLFIYFSRVFKYTLGLFVHMLLFISEETKHFQIQEPLAKFQLIELNKDDLIHLVRNLGKMF